MFDHQSMSIELFDASCFSHTPEHRAQSPHHPAKKLFRNLVVRRITTKSHITLTTEVRHYTAVQLPIVLLIKLNSLRRPHVHRGSSAVQNIIWKCLQWNVSGSPRKPHDKGVQPKIVLFSQFCVVVRLKFYGASHFYISTMKYTKFLFTIFFVRHCSTTVRAYIYQIKW